MRSSIWLVPILCGLAVGFDGYDLVVYGTVVPALLEYQAWGLSPEQVGVIGSYAIIGMLFGALIAGTVTDIIGRRKALLICVAWFSVFTAVCGIAPSPEIFGLFRFLAGLGLGGLIPIAAALTLEYAPAHRRNFTYLAMMACYNVGGLLAAGLAIVLIPAFGWRVMFFVALIPLFIVVPLGMKYLPESISFLLAKGRRSEAEAIGRRFGVPVQAVERTVEREEEVATRGGALEGVKTLLSRLYFLRSVAFWVASFFGLMLIYGLSNWLPGVMTEAGYSVGSALSFLVLFQGGAAVGNLIIGGLADRFGTKLVCGLAFTLAGLSIALLSIQMPLVAIYVFAGLAGVGTFGGMTLVYSYIGQYYPASSRATALGWSAGVGRLGAILGPILGGLLVGAGLAVPWGFYTFALAGVLAATIIFLLPRSPVAVEKAEWM
ncbi:MFS transporter [Rubrobacter radiotolerans]|uniref:Aromatic acid/H+ symport family MFS transporter n=1 Tax=Rubrobacter radiotolerans TaxID=42256 RepID=A0AB35T219_RUBRA|nr:aromatic acid/H+ symport family MFS transporter [Rubrobacter radiotolerans]MDX5893755.1 aromatic acid/H+ symport family MFS transporter [Rubrobacter radiotolerans]